MTQLLAQLLDGQATIKLIYQKIGESSDEFSCRVQDWINTATPADRRIETKIIPLPDDDSVEALRGTH